MYFDMCQKQIALMCNKIRQENPYDKILYLVYNNAMKKKAAQSNKFPKQGMDIQTTHSWVLKTYFGTEYMHSFEKKGDYSLKEIINQLGIDEYIRSKFKESIPSGEKGKKWLDRRVNMIAGYIRKTISNFQSSNDDVMKDSHVIWRAKRSGTTRTKWKSEILSTQYVRWADEFFTLVKKRCNGIRRNGRSNIDVSISHDGYLKVAQLEQLPIRYDWVFIDEAQDMSACQASLFWGDLESRRTYVFGDCFQQIYRFRGASTSFRDMQPDHSFSLTGSFRFGKNIASYASCILKTLDGDTLHGRSTDNGLVEVLGEEEGERPKMQKGVVICRTQNGIYKYLHTNRPARWCNLGGPKKFSTSIPKFQHDLELFLKGEKTPFQYKGESFDDISNVEKYITEEDDVELYKGLKLISYLVSKDKSLSEFYSDLQSTFRPMRDNESPDNYNGVVMSTVHKAKGLEFTCQVLIGDDFNFEAIESAVVNSEKHCDEANHLYVAITRAKHHLILSTAAKACLDMLAEKSDTVFSPTYTPDTCNTMFETWKESFEDFRHGRGTFPCPPGWNDEELPLALHPSMSIPCQRKILHTYLRRLHPDKFIPMFSRRIPPRDMKKLYKVLVCVTMKCTAILEALRNEDECSNDEYDQ